MPDQNQNNLPNQPAAPADIYVMPDKFHSQQGAPSSDKGLIISLIILVLVVLATGIYFFFDMWQKNQLANNNQNANLAANTNTNLNTNANVNLNANANANLNANTNIDTNANVNTNVNANTNANVNSNGNAAQMITMTSDSDRDGLTDIEEALLGSAPTKPDTDGDGYLDGQEVLAGFNPIVAGSSPESKLAAAAFMALAKTDFLADNFSVLTLKNWSYATIATLKQIRITAADTGEIIKISALDNPDKVSAANWYLKDHAEVDLAQLKKVTAGNWEGIFAPDGLRAYLTNPERTRIYDFEYTVMDNKGEFRYPAIFTMMIKSFKLEASSTAPTM